jgi:tetratricopeptide (TPR) repeat protein
MNGRSLRAVLLFIGLVCAAQPVSGWPWSNDQRKAERKMRAGDLKSALRHYEMARLRDPDNPALDYNVGNVLHLDTRFDEAVVEYAKVLERSDGNLAQMTHYNVGNTFYRAGDLEKAERSYVNALLENPYDVDAKYNLEMALKAKEEKEQQEEQEKKGGKDEKKDEKQKEPDREQEKQEEDKPQAEDEKEPRPREGKLTKDQAERILNALNEQEKKERKDLKEARSRSGVRVEKDW